MISAAAAAALVAVLAPLIPAPVLSDEVFTLEATALSWPAMWRHLQADVHPPLYYCLAKVWLALAGPAVEGLRALSLLMAALAVFLAAHILPASAPARSWAAWILAADGIVIMMSVYGRMYAMLAALCLLTWLASDRAIHHNSGKWTAAAAAALAAGLLTHHFFALFVLALALWIVLIHGRAALRLAPAWALGGAAWALLWGRAAWEQLAHRPQHLAWVPPAQFAKWAETAGAHLVFLCIAAPIALLALAWRRAARAPWPRESRAAAASAALVLVLPGIISVWRPVLNARFTIIAAPFLAVALAPLGRLTSGVLPVAAFAAASVWMWWPGAQTSCTSAEAARLLAQQTTSSDAVLFCRLTRKPVEYHWPSPVPSRQSFPAEIDQHPGYEGRQPPHKLQQEADTLASALRGRVFLLADSTRTPSRILLRALQDAGFRQRPPLLACPSADKHYFDRLLVFDPPLRLSESPSASPPAPGSPPPGPVARAYAPR
jgi:hypothetical protein